jgi:hypothetical protein
MPFIKMPDGSVAHVRMSKPRVKSCRIPLDGKLCRAKPADRLCDGCDVQLCAGCRVTVRTRGRERDFCSVCFGPVWQSWLKTGGNVGPVVATTEAREARRAAFRAWAWRNPEFFDALPLSKATLAEEAA